MKIREGYIAKEIAGVHLIVSVREEEDSRSNMIKMNESGILLWEKLSGGADREALVQTLLEIYDVTNEIAEKDVDSFLKLLSDAGVLEE